MLDKHEEVHIFMGRKNKKYSPEFKISVIMDMRENHLSYTGTMRKYFPNKDTKDYEIVKKWERIYLKEGVEGLKIERRGRGTKMDNPKIGRPKKMPEVVEGSENELEQLRKKVYYLEAENAYLKKLDALIREEEARKAARKKK